MLELSTVQRSLLSRVCVYVGVGAVEKSSLQKRLKVDLGRSDGNAGRVGVVERW